MTSPSWKLGVYNLATPSYLRASRHGNNDIHADSVNVIITVT